MAIGWDDGLCQDYDKGLGRWFVDRLGARQQLRQDFEMKQHITQDAIRAAGGIIHRDGNIFFTNIEKLNAAIQSYLDQRKAELPVLPDHPEPRTMKWSALEIEAIQAYGQQCVAHARKLALEEAKDVILGFQAGWVPDGFTECADKIELLRMEVK